ncbi:MAG: hypothetical protein FJ009_07940 [Chloroflexi bacterium]|nr:hypothetical protein [Chloroflexota bacterium]
MITGIKQKTIVGEVGKIEISSPQLPSGALVDVIVFVEPEEQDATEYLLSTEANRQHLSKALQDLGDPSKHTLINLADL